MADKGRQGKFTLRPIGATRTSGFGRILPFFAALYDIERDAAVLDVEERRKLRQSWAKPISDTRHEWMMLQSKLVSEGSVIAKSAGIQS